MNGLYIILLLFGIGFGLVWVFRSKPYTLEDWAEVQRIEFEKHGPVSYDEPYLDEHLKIGVITPTQAHYKEYLKNNINAPDSKKHVRISSMEDINLHHFVDVVEGPAYFEVPFSVIKAAMNRKVNNVPVNF